MIKAVKKYGWIFVLVFILGLGCFATSQKAEAASPYKIRINKQQNTVTIYKKNSEGDFEPFKAMVCSTGGATPLGTFSLKEKIRWHILDGPVYGQYCTRITGHILFHSVWYHVNGNPATLSNTQYNKLGTVASHGCIRLTVRDSKWIYDNIPSGTSVEIYNSKDPGPLGKPVAIKLPAGTGWDPTDETNPNNPYNNKKPSITLKKGKAGSTQLKFGSKSSVLDTISAKNTTGFDSITNVTYTVKYKAKGSNKFKKAKKVNTSKVGAYQVKFSLVDEIGRKASLRVNYNVLNKIPLTAFTLNRTAKTLYLGGTTGETTTKIKLKTAKPAKASIQTLKFSSLNTGVATIDAKGKVTAVGVGTATIKAKSMDGSNLKAYCKIRVNKYATGMTASVSASAFDVAQTMQIVTALQPSDATGTNSIGYTFTSSNPAVASVDGQGLITGVSAGTATITVQATGAAKNNKSVSTQIDITINATNVIPGDVSSSALGIN